MLDVTFLNFARSFYEIFSFKNYLNFILYDLVLYEYEFYFIPWKPGEENFGKFPRPGKNKPKKCSKFPETLKISGKCSKIS